MRIIIFVFTLSFLSVCWAEDLPAPTSRPILSVSGKIKLSNSNEQARFDLAMLDTLAQHSIKTETPWYDQPRTFSGPLARDLLKKIGAQGVSVKATALNDYAIDIPISDFYEYDVVLATRIDGKTLSVREKGPIFVIYPFDQVPETKNEVIYQRCIWQLNRLEVK